MAVRLASPSERKQRPVVPLFQEGMQALCNIDFFKHRFLVLPRTLLKQLNTQILLSVCLRVCLHDHRKLHLHHTKLPGIKPCVQSENVCVGTYVSVCVTGQCCYLPASSFRRS